MKFNKTLMGAMGLAVSANAFALNPTDPVHVEMFMSGASAQRDTLQHILSTNCKAGTLDTYFDNGGVAGAESGKNFRAYFCTFGTTGGGGVAIPASLQNKNVLITYRFKGGSIYGVNPIARSEAVTFMDMSAANCSNPNGDAKWSCGSATISKVPDLGVSDVEPGLFKGPNIPVAVAGDPENPWKPLKALEINNLDKKPAYSVVFGVAVSNDVATNNLTKTEIQSIFNGKYTDWRQVQSANGLTGAINICRRTAGSGTQAAANAYFLNNPCSSTIPFRAHNGTSVLAFDSSDKVLTDCLNTKTRAIGISAIEKQPGGANGSNWHYVAINGVVANEANAAMGKYDNQFENSMQFRKSTPAGAIKDLMVLVRNEATKAATLSAAGLTGVNALISNGNTANNPYVATNPVNWGSRAGLACNPLLNSFPF